MTLLDQSGNARRHLRVHTTEDPTFADLGLADARCLLVASTGGHLAELERVMSVVRPADSSALVTFDTPQSRSLDFAGDVHFVPYIAPRDLLGTAKGVRYFNSLMSQRWDAVISTGSAIALSALPVARARRTRSIYVESFSRFDGPSLTGRLLSPVPGVEKYTQHQTWADGTWRYAGSVLDSVRPTERVSRAGTRTVFVTLGTIQPYRFDALVDAVKRNLPRGVHVIWQLGSTTRADLPGEVHIHMSHDAFLDAASRADLVVSHAGTGTAIELVEMGHKPILVPRRASRQEHIDDHQVQIVAELQQRGLVTARHVETLSVEDLMVAS